MSSENEDDKLSILPKEIVSHILSLMPTKFAVQTSILSKRWRCNWMFVTNLHFEDIHKFQKNDEDVDTVSNFVNRVLKFRKTSDVKSFRLHFNSLRLQRSSVSKWIEEAVRLNVHELDIHVIDLELPLSMLTCKTLTKLRLNCEFYYHYEVEPRSLVYLPCLKSIDIASHDITFDNAIQLIRGCPIVECISLNVWRCLDYDHDEDCIFNIPTLKRLKLTFFKCCSLRQNVIVLNTPNLEYLFVGGVLLSFFEMEDVSSLLEASLSFGEKSSTPMWVQLIKGISRVRSLSLRNVSSYFDFKILFTSPPAIFLNMKQLKFNGICHCAPVFYFLEICPELKHLIIEKLEDSVLIEPKWVPVCMLTKLTTMKLSTCNGQKWDIEFLQYMLANAAVLKMVTISWKNSSIDEVDKRLFAKLINSFPKASGSCEIHFQGLILPAAN